MSESGIGAKTYWLTWVGLMVLTVTTFGLSYAELGSAEMAVALGIAAVKAGLVTLFFMHLIESPFGYRFVLVIGVLFIVVMMSFTLLDLVARGSPGVRPPVKGNIVTQPG
jgi:cytochrome c oxidase subunit 4